MNRQVFHPESDAGWHALRAQDITSTDCPALFGLSPYKTPFELWHEKKAGERIEFADNDRMKWGRRLEAVVAQGIAEDRGWSIFPMKEYVRLSEHRIGSSFDFQGRVSLPIEFRVGVDPAPQHFILEIKCVDFLAFRDGWTIDEGFIEAPTHIELQVQHQMLVSGLRRAYIGVMVGGNRIEVIERLADDAVHAGIIAKVREFWQSIEAGRAPDPVMPDDAEAVIRMHGFAEPGKLYDARKDAELAQMIADYHQIGREAADLEEIKKVRKAEILAKIGDAEKVLLDGYSVSAGMVGPDEVAYTRAGYRNFRVTAKKPGKAAQAAE